MQTDWSSKINNPSRLSIRRKQVLIIKIRGCVKSSRHTLFFILQNFNKLFLSYIKLIGSRGKLQMMEVLITTYVSDSRCLFQWLTIL